MNQISHRPLAKFPAKLLLIAAAVAVGLIGLAVALAIVLPSTVVSGFAVSLGALATLTLAVLTAVLLWANWQVVHATTKMADATADEAAATREEAAATKESAQASKALADASQSQTAESARERTARWEPLITARLMYVPGNGPRSVVIENLGLGPALDVVYIAVVTDPIGLKAWFLAGPVNMHSDTSDEIPLNVAYGIEQTSYEISDTSSTTASGEPLRRFTRRFIRAFTGDASYRGQTTEPNELIGLPMPPAVLFDRPQQLSGSIDGREEAMLCRCVNGHIHRALTHLRVPQEEFDPDDSTRTWLDWYKRIALSGLAAPRMADRPDPRVIRTEAL
jgi:hypothetical protein